MKVFVLLDRSGSMNAHWVETIGSVNAYVQGLKPSTDVYFAIFDRNGELDYQVVRESKVKGWNPVTVDEIKPRGYTPLYDAFGRLASKMEEDNIKKSIAVVMTDGYENASKEYTQATVKTKIAEFEGKNWPVVFLGANFDDVTKAGANIGTVDGSTFNMVPDQMVAGMQAYASMTMDYAKTGTRGSLNIDTKLRKKLSGN